MEPEITIAVACYNEEDSILLTLHTLLAALANCSFAWEIIVMDDASKDNSQTLVREFLNKHPNLPIQHSINIQNQGLENNIFKAVALGKGKYFWAIAGDNALNKETYVKMLSQIGKADIIIPQVLAYQGRRFGRNILSKGYVMIVNLISGEKIKYYNGSSIYLRNDILNYSKHVRGFGYSAELILLLIDEGRSFIEIQVTFDERKSGKSTAVCLKNFYEIFLFFLRLASRRLAKIQNQIFATEQQIKQP